jgi:hypothetical protein
MDFQKILALSPIQLEKQNSLREIFHTMYYYNPNSSNSVIQPNIISIFISTYLKETMGLHVYSFAYQSA